MHESYDCIVVGIGGVGSAAAVELARRGVRVLGLDQYGPAHDQGSSHGRTRIIRTAYFEHPNYVPLLRRAYEYWRTLEEESGCILYDPVGLFLSGPADSSAVAGTRRAASEHNLPIDQLPASEAQSRFPHFRFDPDSLTLFERDAGRLHVEACVSRSIERARALGAELRFHEPVVNWSEAASHVQVCTDQRIYHADQVLFAAGAWTSSLVRRLGIPLQVRRKVQLWFQSPDDAYREAPCFFYEEPTGEFYGLPEPTGGWVKVAEHTGGEIVDDPALVERMLLDSDVGPPSKFVRERLPGLTASARQHSVCLYTMSPDGHFILDKLPGSQRVLFVAGLSGHGFKFAGVLGEALADLTTTGGTDLPIDFLRLARFESASLSAKV